MYKTQWKLDHLKHCTSPRMDRAVEKVIELMRETGTPVPKQKRYLSDLKDHIRAILCNLISAQGTGLDIWITFLKGHENSNGGKSPQGFQFTTTQLNKVTDFLRKEGYIEIIPGYNQQHAGGDSKPSMMQATSRLLDLHDVDPQSVYRDTFPVVLKGKKVLRVVRDRHGKPKKDDRGKDRKEWKRKWVTVPNNRKVQGIKANLEIINQVLRESRIDLEVDLHTLDKLNRQLAKDPDERIRPIDFSHKQLYRVFLDGSFDVHGRFYGPWHINVPEDYREKILINGTPVVEYDFGYFHPSMLYCMERLKIPQGDLYLLPDTPPEHKPWRKLLKNFTLMMINAKDDKAAINAMIRRYREDARRAQNQGKPFTPPPIVLNHANLFPLAAQIRDRHEPIQHYFDQADIGNILMYKDSQIAEQVMLHFARKGIACLPVHDSFLVDMDHARECFDVMLGAFQEMFGQAIPVDGSDLEAIVDAMKRPPVWGRSKGWDKLESEIIYLSKVDSC